jgi:hypothetical protein
MASFICDSLGSSADAAQPTKISVVAATVTITECELDFMWLSCCY